MFVTRNEGDAEQEKPLSSVPEGLRAMNLTDIGKIHPTLPIKITIDLGDLPGGPVAKTSGPHSQRRGSARSLVGS